MTRECVYIEGGVLNKVEMREDSKSFSDESVFWKVFPTILPIYYYFVLHKIDCFPIKYSLVILSATLFVFPFFRIYSVSFQNIMHLMLLVISEFLRTSKKSSIFFFNGFARISYQLLNFKNIAQHTGCSILK